MSLQLNMCNHSVPIQMSSFVAAKLIQLLICTPTYTTLEHYNHEVEALHTANLLLELFRMVIADVVFDVHENST